MKAHSRAREFHYHPSKRAKSAADGAPPITKHGTDEAIVLSLPTDSKKQKFCPYNRTCVCTPRSPYTAQFQASIAAEASRLISKRRFCQDYFIQIVPPTYSTPLHSTSNVGGASVRSARTSYLWRTQTRTLVARGRGAFFEPIFRANFNIFTANTHKSEEGPVIGWELIL